MWPTRYRRSAPTAAKSKATRAITVTASTPASTRVRSWARGGRCSVRMARQSGLRGSHRGGLGAGTVDPLGGGGQAQAVADAPLGMDHVRAVLCQFAPQIGDVGGDNRARAAEVVVPHVGQQL